MMPPTNENVVEIIELTKVFRDFWGRQSVKALDELNLDVKRGEVFGLLGPNGSGKTTCIRIVLGLLFPTRGAVRLFGRSPRNVEVKKRIGYMPEESHLYSYLNAEETLDFYGRLFQLSPAERRRRTNALIDMVGLKRARRRPVGQYSKGMARRIGLAQSLINDPDLVILDEPTTGLDPIGTREMKDLILTLRERGKSIFLCSHLLADVEDVCDRICVLYGGKQRAVGSVNELLVTEDVTQIRMPRLEAAAIQRLVGTIGELGAPADAVEVSAPRRSLEDYFLSVVREAERDNLATAGAEMGSAAASFLGAEEPEGEDLVAELVQAGRRESEPDLKAAAEPAPIATFGADDELIDGLVAASAQSGGADKEAAEEPADAGAVAPAAVRRGVLDELISAAEEDGGGDGDSDS